MQLWSAVRTQTMSVSSCKVVIRLVVDYVSGRARKAWPRFFHTDSGRALSAMPLALMRFLSRSSGEWDCHGAISGCRRWWCWQCETSSASLFSLCRWHTTPHVNSQSMLGVRWHKHEISSPKHRTVCLTILAIDQLAKFVDKIWQLLWTPLSELFNDVIYGLRVVVRPSTTPSNNVTA